MLKNILLVATIILLTNITYSSADKSMKIGSKGSPNNIDRTIIVKMYDNYFDPDQIVFNNNETIKFEVTNSGDFVHEFNIGNTMMHIEHQKDMEKMIENEIILADSIDKVKMHNMAESDHSMGHSHSNSLLLEPGESGTLIWNFTNASNIEIACNVPGHYDVGMILNLELL
ncbi:MAG: copper-binding protein [Rhodobiaceae bacterium]|nr:copper-binding protein [Rhodobiaceae bacterium]RPF96778.1 MAG: copper-binding protein [Rhizobiales bacterium TMED227]